MSETSNTDTVQDCRDKGNTAFRGGRFQEALEWYSKAIELGTDSKDILGKLLANRSYSGISLCAQMSEGQEKTDLIKAAIADAERATKALPQWGKGFFRLGQALMLDHEFTKARKALEVARRHFPGDKDVRSLLESARANDSSYAKSPLPVRKPTAELRMFLDLMAPAMQMTANMAIQMRANNGYGETFSIAPQVAADTKWKRLERIPAERPIHLAEMAKHTDKVYQSYTLLGTIVGPVFCMSAIHTIIEDTKGDCLRICFYGLDEAKTKKIRCGQQIAIMHPYFRIGADGGQVIRVEEPSFVEFGEFYDICHVCHAVVDEDAAISCQCGARYCSADCQKYDRQQLQHQGRCFSVLKLQ